MRRSVASRLEPGIAAGPAVAVPAAPPGAPLGLIKLHLRPLCCVDGSPSVNVV